MPSLSFLLIWPGTLVALLLGYFAHVNRLVAVAALAAALGLPLLLYLVATPRFQWWAAAIILTNFASVAVLRRGRQRLAVALFSLYPVFLVAVMIMVNQ